MLWQGHVRNTLFHFCQLWAVNQFTLPGLCLNSWTLLSFISRTSVSSFYPLFTPYGVIIFLQCNDLLVFLIYILLKSPHPCTDTRHHVHFESSLVLFLFSFYCSMPPFHSSIWYNVCYFFGTAYISLWHFFNITSHSIFLSFLSDFIHIRFTKVNYHAVYVIVLLPP